MRLYPLALVCLVLGACSPNTLDEAAVKRVVKAKAETIASATISGDYAAIADATHPKVIEMGGGRARMIAAMKTAFDQMRTAGYGVADVRVEAPADLVRAGNTLYAVVPMMLEMKTPQGVMEQRGFVVGVSSDLGKSWSFVDGSVGPEKIKQVLPDLPAQLTLPEMQPMKLKR